MSAHIVMDWETTGLDKPFGYDLGYLIFDDDFSILEERHFVIEQVWHNLPLFESAYYKEKRQKYVQLMRAKKATMDKFGYVMSQMRRDIKNYNVVDVYAYNSPFDDKVFTFNCDWFKCINPIEALPVYDIRGYANNFITNSNDYKAYCEAQELFTDSGNYSATAESVYRYITMENGFEEAHMGLYDCQIELEILGECVRRGAEFGKDYPVTKVIARPSLTPYKIKVNGKIIHEGLYIKKYIRNNTYNFTENARP